MEVLRCASGEALGVRARVRAHRELFCEVAVYPQQPRLDLDVPEHRDLRSRALDLKLVEPSYLGHDRVLEAPDELVVAFHRLAECVATVLDMLRHDGDAPIELTAELDRKSTRLNSSHRCSSYAGFCLKKKRSKVMAGAVERVETVRRSPPGLKVRELAAALKRVSSCRYSRTSTGSTLFRSRKKPR